MSLMQRFRLDGKTALVTGASRGIGLAIARVLGEAGARLVISSKTARPEVVASLKKAGYTVDYIQVRLLLHGQWVTAWVTQADVATTNCCGHNLQLLPTDIQGWPRHGQCYR